MALPQMQATTILCVRKDGKVAMAGDGQVTVGDTIMKARATKVRMLKGGRCAAGFAGGAADAITLFEKFEEKLDRFPGNLTRAAVELAKDWRSDRVLRRLEAQLVIADKDQILSVTGNGEVVDPDEPVMAIGSGGAYALAAARALLVHSPLTAKEIAEQAMGIAADICIYTNRNLTLVELE